MENWKSIPDLIGYEVSDHGNVRSWVPYKNLPLPRYLTKRPLKRYPYLRVSIKSKDYYIHDLVLTTFVGPRPPYYWAAHQNDIKFDNRLENLRWDTPRGNFKDKEHRVIRDKDGKFST